VQRAAYAFCTLPYGGLAMKIAIGSDHGGFNLKGQVAKHLEGRNIEYRDFGTYSLDSCDYPIYGKAVAEAVASGEFDLGILVCGTGLGISLAANKVKGIRAVCVSDTFSAEMGKAHNNANILSLGERVLGTGLAIKIVDTFLDTPFEGGRHEKRVNLIEG
jgi:ribose 5-phosphate isomerase B